MIHIFIPSYHRPRNLKTVSYFLKIGWEPQKLIVFVDNIADDIDQYQDVSKQLGFTLVVFDMAEARRRYDYVHRPSTSRRSAGQARNMFYDYAKSKGIGFFVMMDDDTRNYQVHPFGKYIRMATRDDIIDTYSEIREMMVRQKIGLFGLSQTGDMFAVRSDKLIRWKVMNTTFINTRYIYRGERGVQDDDTSQFSAIMNRGLFTGSMASGLVLQQTASATATGGLTELYNECKLLNKALVCPIQFPSAIIAEKQVCNGGRIHHRINNKKLFPRVLKIPGHTGNIAWDTYQEDGVFTNCPYWRS